MDFNSFAYHFLSKFSMVDTKEPESIYKIHVLHTGSEPAGTEQLLSLARPDITISLCNAEYLLAPYMNHLYSRAHFSKEMYFRWWIGELFPEYDKAIYLRSSLLDAVLMRFSTTLREIVMASRKALPPLALLPASS